MLSLKLKRIGKSVGFILQKEMLSHFGVKEGFEIFAVETPTGYTLTALDSVVQKQAETGDAFMDRYRDVFAALANR